ncbi:MAG TPA: YhgE/Pip family protein, partial [Coriobacteriia bacterium]|nr:YhgE/Pip family protein [Coriobacteriia bacterium]
ALAAGSTSLAKGAKKLHAGAKEAASGATRLSSGVSRVADGSRALAHGLDPAVEGSEELASGLTAGVDEMPTYSKASRTRHASMMSDPVQLESTAINAVPNYGTGFAPYFLPISLWVGSLVTFLFVAPLPQRRDSESPLRQAFSGWLAGSLIGIVQAALLVLVVVRALGLSAVHSGWVWALLLLTAVVFAAIQQMLAASLGPAGKFLAIVLLVLQLTSASGTFPIEMQPAFFQAIHPFLPMTYVVSGLRLAISGGAVGAFGADIVSLLTFGVIALVTTAFVARAGGSPLEKRLSASIDI